MTIEHNIVVGVDDIKAVIVACNCGIRYSMSPDNICIPANCPNPDCRAAWSAKPSHEVASGHEEWASANLSLAAAIRRVRNNVKTSGGFTLLMEFEAKVDADG